MRNTREPYAPYFVCTKSVSIFLKIVTSASLFFRQLFSSSFSSETRLLNNMFVKELMLMKTYSLVVITETKDTLKREIWDMNFRACAENILVHIPSKLVIQPFVSDFHEINNQTSENTRFKFSICVYMSICT